MGQNLERFLHWFNHLRDLKSQVEAIGCGDRGVASGSHSNQPIYELYAKTETAKFSHLSKVSGTLCQHSEAIWFFSVFLLSLSVEWGWREAGSAGRSGRKRRYEGGKYDRRNVPTTNFLSPLSSLSWVRPSLYLFLFMQCSTVGGLDADQNDLSVSCSSHMTVMWYPHYCHVTHRQQFWISRPR